MRINGPYRHTSGRLKGRAYICIINDDGSRTTKLYSRYLMEQHLGRQLSYDETVDHINEDPTDDRLENLQILTRRENAEKSHQGSEPEMFRFNCPQCGESAEKLARHVRHNRKLGKAGPFCSRRCARLSQLAEEAGLEPVQ